jgi:type II secretory pathway component GspD/PulD (secretin)
LRNFVFFALSLIPLTAGAAIDHSFPFTFQEAPLNKVVGIYSAQTNQRFVIDPSVSANTKVTIIESGKISGKEAYNLLSASLALEGIAISNRDGTYVVAGAKTIQRSYIPVVTDLPTLQPEKLVTWIVTLKNADANGILQQLRMLTSKEGEMVAYGQNRLMITDWVSNLYRVHDLIEHIDKPTESKAPPVPTIPNGKG